MKKALALLTGACLLFTTAVGCSSTTTESTSTATATTEAVETAQSYHVVATNYAVYDWTTTLLEGTDNVTVTYLLDSGVDSHSYQPSADDIIEIATCDMFVYIGGESDTWVDAVLAQATNHEMIVLNLMEALGDGTRAEETVEGMEVSEHDHEEEATEEEHDHDHEEEAIEEEHDHDHEEEAIEEEHDHDHEEDAHDDEHDHDHEEEATEEEHDHDHEEEATEEEHDHDHEEDAHDDEHIWLSLVNAQVLSSVIAEQLVAMDGDNADVYDANLQGYLADLVDLDGQYAAAVEAATGNTILVADRFPLLYLVSDYGIAYYAAFNGCSAETEASFETIVFLAGKVDELGLTTILTIENPQHEIAQTVAATAVTQTPDVLVLDSMQSVTAANIDSGISYYHTMAQNLTVLVEALG